MLEKMLLKLDEVKGSDLYLASASVPFIKINGKLVALGETSLAEDQVKEIILNSMNAETKQQFVNDKEANYAIELSSGIRYRANAYWQRDKVCAVIRRIENEIPDITNLGLPNFLQQLCLNRQGLILVVGATGSGKSSTLASMIKYRNQETANHIITIEDPIEFSHSNIKSLISQREVGIDTYSFIAALQNTLRQAPDLIVIGEIRNREVMEYALKFAETGHLCLSTLHANNANQAISRIINLFPEEIHKEILFNLSINLVAIIGQRLIKSTDNKVVLATEIMINTPTISELIAQNKINEIKEHMLNGETHGMHTFDQALYKLVKDKKITEDMAIQYADSAKDLKLMFKLDGKAENKLD